MFTLIFKIVPINIFIILSFYLINYARNICEISINNNFIATYVYITNIIYLCCYDCFTLGLNTMERKKPDNSLCQFYFWVTQEL